MTFRRQGTDNDRTMSALVVKSSSTRNVRQVNMVEQHSRFDLSTDTRLNTSSMHRATVFEVMS